MHVNLIFPGLVITNSKVTSKFSSTPLWAGTILIVDFSKSICGIVMKAGSESSSSVAGSVSKGPPVPSPFRTLSESVPGFPPASFPGISSA